MKQRTPQVRGNVTGEELVKREIDLLTNQLFVLRCTHELMLAVRAGNLGELRQLVVAVASADARAKIGELQDQIDEVKRALGLIGVSGLPS
jgi:hypothetical protein